MANTFVNAYLDVTSSAQTVYTAPTATNDVAIVLTIRITNVDGGTDDTIKAEVLDQGGSARSYIAYEMAVPADSSIELAGTSKIVLEAGDSIQLQGGNSSGDLEAFVSALEIT